MSRNIKEIGKELLGKSLNSYHRKTGLTQLEKNNEMQDGILDGILSQVDDAYIEKTEQSNVIHLEGSGDGVVVLDSIEGNTMVNLIITNMMNFENNSVNAKNITTVDLKPSTTYTFVAHLKDVSSTNTWLARFHFNNITDGKEFYINVAPYQTYTSNSIVKYSFTTPDSNYKYKRTWVLWNSQLPEGEKMSFHNAMLIEGDWTNKEVNLFNGLQSSFEEKVNDEGKYEIEILSRNKNLIDKEYFAQQLLTKSNITREMFNGKDCLKINSNLSHTKVYFGTNDNEYKTLRFSAYTNSTDGSSICHYGVYLAPSLSNWSNSYGAEKYNFVEIYNYVNERIVYIDLDSIQLEYGTSFTNYTQHKQNKIKLLINEPLRAVDNTKDRLCVKDGRLTIERNTFLHVLNGQEIWNINNSLNTSNTTRYYTDTLTIPMTLNSNGISDKIPYITGGGNDNMTCIYVHSTINRIDIRRLNSDNRWSTLEQLKTWLRNNNITLVLKRLEPIYEEVLNEYGEPIILEGYENGTLYIDSAIIPTTTVRYTPKMESFKTLNEVSDNNTMLTNDINDNIIPYLMDVDLMIMEKEMALPSQINIRKMEVLDMTSMQKRTQDMLERLIKGKTLTEQECKTRVAVYLNAGKITDEQAKELNFLIDEIYA